MVRSALVFELIYFFLNPVVVFQTNPAPALLGTINKDKTMRTRTKNPSEMTSLERIEEIASILSRSMSRFKNNEALNGPTALKFHFLKVSSPRDLVDKGQGWCFLDNPKIDLSSSELLKALRAGETNFNDPFQDVADYIKEKMLYI